MSGWFHYAQMIFLCCKYINNSSSFDLEKVDFKMMLHYEEMNPLQPYVLCSRQHLQLHVPLSLRYVWGRGIKRANVWGLCHQKDAFTDTEVYNSIIGASDSQIMIVLFIVFSFFFSYFAFEADDRLPSLDLFIFMILKLTTYCQFFQHQIR